MLAVIVVFPTPPFRLAETTTGTVARALSILSLYSGGGFKLVAIHGPPFSVETEARASDSRWEAVQPEPSQLNSARNCRNTQLRAGVTAKTTNDASAYPITCSVTTPTLSQKSPSNDAPNELHVNVIALPKPRF